MAIDANLVIPADAVAPAAASHDDDPLWYKDAIIYQLHIKSFFDSNNDGIGDFAGLMMKLDYIADLGVNTIWLLPFYPSPRLDDGYDIAEYRAVHRDYGGMADVKRFIAAAHARGLRVVTELVINHTSDQHPWFQRARKARPGSPASLTPSPSRSSNLTPVLVAGWKLPKSFPISSSFGSSSMA